jgi:hypothetical protein
LSVHIVFDVDEQTDFGPHGVTDSLEPVQIGVELAASRVQLEPAVLLRLLSRDLHHRGRVFIPTNRSVHLGAGPERPTQQGVDRHTQRTPDQVQQRGVDRGDRERRRLQHPGKIMQQRQPIRRITAGQHRGHPLLH